MEIQVKVEASAVAVLSIEGRLIAGTGAATLMHAVDAILEQGYQNIVLDMWRVEKVDCAGIGQLVNCYHKTRQRGGALKLARAGRQLRMLLALFGLEAVLENFESVRDAVACVTDMPAQAASGLNRISRPDAARRPVGFAVS